MLDFCPFDFNKIDMDNLAYELVFADEWNWEKVKAKTIIGTAMKAKKIHYINENDTRREINYIERGVDVKHVMLLENDVANGKNGLQQLLELIEKGVTSDREREETRRIETNSNSDIDYGEEISTQLAGSDTRNLTENYENMEAVVLKHEVLNGIDTFFDKYHNIIMYAMPCCPYCHNRLPIGWKRAEDFIAVSLIAPTLGGKTTLLCSMMHKNWSVFQNYKFTDGRRLYINAAHMAGDPTDTAYAAMQEDSDKMCKVNGTCPQNTSKSKWISPIFLNIQFEGHCLILGIYDNAGENLQYANPNRKTNLQMLLDKMFADIYLFDPKDINIKLPKEKKKSADSGIEILNLEEQGRMQREQANATISAESILSMPEEEREEKFNILEVHNQINSSRSAAYKRDEMKNMYFMGVLIKCDLLENVNTIKNNDRYKVLLDRKNPEKEININQMIGRSDLVRSMFEGLELLGEDASVEDFEEDYGDGKSFWHCISALGCDAVPAGPLKGKYAPIRIADPILTCIVRRIADNKWL